MLQLLELENFKAFGERARIPFAPITLIFGENSAGKSTILQALYLLKQSREAGALLLPRAEKGIVDLGSFQEMIFDHDLKRTLSIRVETTMDDIFGLPDIEDKIAIEFSFKRPSLKEEVLLNQIEIYYGKSSKRIAKFRPLGKTVEPQEFWMMMGFFRDPRGLPPSKLAAVKCNWLTKATEYWEPEFEWCKANKKEILRELEERESHLERLLEHQTDQGKDSNEQKHSNEELQEANRLRRDLDSLSVDLNVF